MRKKVFLSYVLIGMISLLISTGCSSSTGPSKAGLNDPPMDDENVGWEIGKTAPDFTLNTINHDTISLSQYRGKVVFLFFLGNN